VEFPNIPVHAPSPDAQRFVDALMGRCPAGHVPMVEYIVDDVVMEPILTGMLGRSWTPPGTDRGTQQAYLDNLIQFWYRMGYDFVRYEEGLPLPEKKLLAADVGPVSTKERAWADEYHGAIASWDDFEKYPWPRVEEFDFFPFEYLSRHLPDGMGLISCHAGGVFEHLSWIMSLEGLSIALCEDPDLVRAVAEKLGELMTGFYRHILDLDNLIAVFPGDDMGFRTATLVSPDALRTYTLPWHKKFAAMTHAKGLPYFLHSCGMILKVLDDLVNDVRIDGKHSYEDAIIPVQDFQSMVRGKIAVLGGVDINILSGGTPEEVRNRTRYLLRVCGARGRYAIGSGNSVPSYVPVENYLAMIDESHAYTNNLGKT
jgi:uroporphyrinogen decarboxylase